MIGNQKRGAQDCWEEAASGVASEGLSGDSVDHDVVILEELETPLY
jgi:hypothetical protein